MRITGGLTKRLLLWSDEHNGGKSCFIAVWKVETSTTPMDPILGLQGRVCSKLMYSIILFQLCPISFHAY